MAEKKDKTLLIVGGLAVAGIVAYLLLKKPAPPLGYPKLICRNPYCFDVYNEEEEIQMREFLGLDPVGADIDTYLSGLTQIQLDEWRDYWVPIWTAFNRYDVITFVNEKYNEYSEAPGYPKQICRDPYCFTIYNEAEEIQMNEFLGIDPPGLDIDTYLSALAQADLDYWKNYWIPIWTALMRNDIVDFVNQKYNQYSELGISVDITNFAVV